MQDCSTFGCEPNLYASHSVVARRLASRACG